MAFQYGIQNESQAKAQSVAAPTARAALSFLFTVIVSLLCYITGAVPLLTSLSCALMDQVGSCFFCLSTGQGTV